jgi:hypothetical protein
MGQNRKVRKSRNKNKLDVFLPPVLAPIEKYKPKPISLPNYNFRSEVEKDAKAEERLLYAEIVVLIGILGFSILRSMLLAG